MKICVMLGGASTERSVSIESAKAVVEGLKKNGHELLLVDPALAFDDKNDIYSILEKNELNSDNFIDNENLNEKDLSKYIHWLKKEKVDLVFNAMHGGNGENGILAAHLQVAEIPYTGSSVQASSIAMDKYRCKNLFKGAGIPTADFELCDIPIHKPERIAFPLVIKPSNAGSSVGLYVLKEKQDIFDQTRNALQFDNQVLIEEFIAGRELTVPILAGKAYPVVEIDPEGGVYDFEHKYSSGKSQYYVPARINEKESDEVQKLALQVWDLLGLQNYSRIDFRMDKKGRFFCLEANTLPGMTATSLLPKSIAHEGIDFPMLLEMIIEDAMKLRS